MGGCNPGVAFRRTLTPHWELTLRTPLDHVLWTLRKEQTLVKGAIRQIPDDEIHHLRIFVANDGSWDNVYDMRGCPPGLRAKLEAEAVRHQDRLINQGFVDASGMWPKDFYVS